MRTDEETQQTIIAGMGELHLEIILDRLRREFKVEANVGKPQVAYKEAITKTVEKEGRFVRQTGGKGQYGDVWLRVEPQPPGTGFVFEWKIVGGTVPKEYAKAVQEGVRESAQSGVLAGFPVHGLQGRRPSTARTTRSTRRRWPSRSPLRWRGRKPTARPARFCSSRS